MKPFKTSQFIVRKSSFYDAGAENGFDGHKESLDAKLADLDSLETATERIKLSAQPSNHLGTSVLSPNATNKVR